MRMDMTTSIAKTGQTEMETVMAMYLIGDMFYWMDFRETDPMWTKSEMPEEYWEEMRQVEPQIELLEAAQVEVIGSERIGGIDCYVLEVTPDLEQLNQLSLRLAYQEAQDVTEEFLQEIFRSFSVKQWVAKDTYFLTKADIDMSMEFTPEEEGIWTSDMAMVLLSYNYNQPVSIEESLHLTNQERKYVPVDNSRV